MQKFTFFKTLLVAVLLCGGSSVWAAVGDVTTNANIDFANNISGGAIAGTVNSIIIGNNTAKGSNGDGNLIVGNGTSTVTIPSAQYAGSRDKVTISFDLGFGKLSGKEVFFNAKDADGSAIFNVSYNVYNDNFSANTLGVSGNDWYHAYNTVIWDRRATFTIVIDYDKKTITTSVKNNFSGGTTEHLTSLTNLNPVATFNVGSNYNNDDRRCEFDNLLIQTTEGDYSVSNANYTVKYVCGSVSVKNDDVRSGAVGSPISLLATDKDAFNANDKRYIYVSDDLGTKTVLENGTQVVTITFREAEKYGYTVSSSYNEKALAWSASGTVWEDQNTVWVQLPRFQTYEGTTLVEAPYGANGDLSKSMTVTSDGFTTDFAYSSTGITNLYLLSEAENLGTGIATNSTTFTSRVSNSAIIHAASGTLLSLPAGKYKFTLGVIGGDNQNHQVAYTVSAGASQIIEGTCMGNVLTLMASEEFTLTEPTDITFTCSDPASGRGIDLIYIQQTSASATITSAGWATLYTPYALDFSGVEGLTAYTATYENDVVTLTAVDDVPANTGVVLQGAANTYSIPVIASSTTAKGDLAGSATEATAYNAIDGKDLYMLVMNTDNEAQFTLVNAGEIAAGKAYLPVAKAVNPSDANIRVVIVNEEATAITGVVGEKADDAAIFNLSGQRVGKDYKGIVIKNGKKMLAK